MSRIALASLAMIAASVTAVPAGPFRLANSLSDGMVLQVREQVYALAGWCSIMQFDRICMGCTCMVTLQHAPLKCMTHCPIVATASTPASGDAVV
jgi:hypothetical protein